MLHAVRTQRMKFRKTDLHRIEAENIRRQRIQPLLFPRPYVLAKRGIEPVVERYNGIF